MVISTCKYCTNKDPRSVQEQFNFPVVYQSIHSFCIEELLVVSIFLFSKIANTCDACQLLRQTPGQTVMYHIANAMLRWLAPILSFTAEEAWQYMPNHNESIFLNEWYSLPIDTTTDRLAAFYDETGGCESCWSYILQLREIVNRRIEAARNKNEIGSALESNLIIHCQSESFIGGDYSPNYNRNYTLFFSLLQ